MNHQQKQLAFELLTGEYYLMLKKNSNGTHVYTQYKGNQVPVKNYSVANVKTFRQLLKTDKKKRLTINLGLVRQLHGRSHIKRTYKNLQTKVINKANDFE